MGALLIAREILCSCMIVLHVDFNSNDTRQLRRRNLRRVNFFEVSVYYALFYKSNRRLMGLQYRRAGKPNKWPNILSVI